MEVIIYENKNLPYQQAIGINTAFHINGSFNDACWYGVN